jgi:hypothetical protein
MLRIGTWNVEYACGGGVKLPIAPLRRVSLELSGSPARTPKRASEHACFARAEASRALGDANTADPTNMRQSSSTRDEASLATR